MTPPMKLNLSDPWRYEISIANGMGCVRAMTVAELVQNVLGSLAVVSAGGLVMLTLDSCEIARATRAEVRSDGKAVANSFYEALSKALANAAPQVPWSLSKTAFLDTISFNLGVGP